MHGLVVIEGMNLSGHPWIINEMMTLFKCFMNHYKRTNMTQDDNFLFSLVCIFVHSSAGKLVQPEFQPSAYVSASFRFDSNQLLGSI